MAAWRCPEHFDGYRLGREIGRGAMGSVHLATDTLLEREVAVKFLHTARLSPGGRERFLTEARALARLQHPNVVSVYRAGEVDGCPYLVSELVRGAGLNTLGKPLPWRRVLPLAMGLARGLAAAHRQRVLHRDLKPANLMLGADGELKLVDFGFAKLLQPQGADEEGTAGEREVGLGTPAYMAPESWHGEPASTRADIYSAGAVLYDLCSGHPPHLDGDLAEPCAEVAALEVEPLAQRGVDVDPRFAALIERCLRVEPAERFPSAEELLSALEALVAGERRGAVPSGNPYRGLHAFEAEHRTVFFGREVEARSVLERLRTEAFVLVAGDSGIGKSSLCRAGVLPEIEAGALGGQRRWTGVSLTPGRRPLTALTTALAAALGLQEEVLGPVLRTEGAAAGRLLRKSLGEDAGLVLFIDQLEELLTLSEPGEADAACELLGGLSISTPGVRLLASARSDFLTRLAGVPGLGAGLNRALYLLQPLTAEGLRSAIAGPAAASGVELSEELVETLLQSVSGMAGGLPLLQFALAELWEQRSSQGPQLTGAALNALGGVSGALARHADGVLAALRPLQRAAARRILPRLVTVAGTRARRTEQELGLTTPDAREALAALVQARLLVAREGEDGAEYEVAHETLLSCWPELRRWLEEDQDLHAVHERLRAAAAEWGRLERSPDALWSAVQLVDARGLEEAELPEEKRAFLRASRLRLRLRRVRAVSSVVALLLLLGGGFAVQRHQLGAQLRRRVEVSTGEARGHLEEARTRSAQLERRRQDAWALFDAGETVDGEAQWRQVLSLEGEVDRLYGEAGQALETALLVDVGREDLRELLAEVLSERALIAERNHRFGHRDELLQRLRLYDLAGHHAARLRAPAGLQLRAPSGTRARLRPARIDAAARSEREWEVGPTGVESVRLEPGPYQLELSHPREGIAVLPLMLARGEQLQVEARLLRPEQRPEGFAYVPPGRFLHGTAADETLRRDFLGAPPQHPLWTAGFLIGIHEVTFREWMTFLESLPPVQRKRHLPLVNRGLGRGSVALRQLPGGGWELNLQPTEVRYTARVGEPVRYGGRQKRAAQDWLRMPVVGISARDAEAYVAWLRQSERVPGARLCTEREWERAARGADGREFPHGDVLLPDDANVDETYRKVSAAFGPDEVGAHPRSRSPFGLEDLAGNAFEWTRSDTSDAYVVRGGCFYNGLNTARSTNREVVEPSLRDQCVGLRVCADLR